jgi:Uma2 family endonuclease
VAFTISEEFLPATLTAHPMTDEEFAELCAEHPDLFFEMTSAGEIIVMPPTYTLTGAQNSEILGQLRDWAKQDGRGVVTDSSAGFVLPNGARRSPDAAWTAKVRVQQLDQKSREGFWHLCPDFVIELKSKTDRLPVIPEKMKEWIGNGAQLGWLVDPENRTVEIYRPNREAEFLTAPASVRGEGPVDGFVLDLLPVWDPLRPATP